jgi:hypothetical protein
MNKLILFVLFLIPALILRAQHFDNHPEKEILPFNAPCIDCIENLEKRTANAREFYKIDHAGTKTIYKQQSLGNLHYQDGKGNWLTNDPLFIKEGQNVFAARHQVSPVVVDFEKRIMSIQNSGKEFHFNKNISLVHIDEQGTETDFGPGNWSRIIKSENYTQTHFVVKDFYNGIDLELLCHYGSIETNFILSSKLDLTGGWLAVRQNVELPEGLNFNTNRASSAGHGFYTGILTVEDEAREKYFWFRKSHAFDANRNYPNYVEMPFSLIRNHLDYYVPVAWLNDSNTLYPVTLDPLVSSTVTIPQSTIAGSGYSAVCDSNGCSYFMNGFTMPAGCEMTKLDSYFGYRASLPCTRNEGGFNITMTSPAGTCATPHMTCFSNIQGICFYWPAPLFTPWYDFKSFLPAPQCSSYTVDFELKLRRCDQALAGCDSMCVGTADAWIMTVEGKTLELDSMILPPIICGDSMVVGIDVTNAHGIPPYSILWNPSGDTSSSIVITPVVPTLYSVSVTDACGNSDTLVQTIARIPYQHPGYTVSPNDTVCDGQQITLTANTPEDSLYSWRILADTSIYVDSVSSFSFMAGDDYLGTALQIDVTYRVDSGGKACYFLIADSLTIEEPTAFFTLISDTMPNNLIGTNHSSWVNPVTTQWSWGDGDTSWTEFPIHTYLDTGNYQICLTITDSSGCTSTYCDLTGNGILTINGQLGVGLGNANHSDDGVSLYPNPAILEVIVTSRLRSRIEATEIFNQLGEKVLAIQFTKGSMKSHQASIDISALPASVYFVKVHTENGSIIKKLIIQ